MRTLISNPTIVNNGEKFRGSIVVNNGKIVEILRENELPRAECDEIVEASGMYLIPGVIDDHVHFREPGLTHKANMASESRAAAAGGRSAQRQRNDRLQKDRGPAEGIPAAESPAGTIRAAGGPGGGGVPG